MRPLLLLKVRGGPRNCAILLGSVIVVGTAFRALVLEGHWRVTCDCLLCMAAAVTQLAASCPVQ
jgi:hypothetical protein